LHRLETQLGSRSKSLPDLGKIILSDVRRFVGGRPQSDDMCLTCFGRE
jgi:serine phosphatase RsbU (regulator of sigma subunit)